ncbi:MAG TPA: hypothetical protein VJ372_25745 [Pyrinomonadaceae bacterium]|jgi:hypothetical protein|nr:hypothetical protein [Pyrinomonadaceae bacterium]
MRDASNQAKLSVASGPLNDRLLHPAWRAFIRYCAELQHGEMESLKIQDGLPVLAEVVKKKVKFTL